MANLWLREEVGAAKETEAGSEDGAEVGINVEVIC